MKEGALSSNLAGRVLSMAATRPDAVALVGHRGRLTYGELERESARLRDRLGDAGVRPGDRVCLLLPKSLDAVVAILGVLRAGAIYVPLDTDSPAARLVRMVRRADTPWLVAAEEVGALAGEVSGSLDRELHIFRLPDGPSGTEASGSDRLAGPEEPAYIFFTSGSTGEPKGVVITHANVSSFLDWAIPYFGLGPDDRMSAHPPLHFDLSVFDIFGALSAGAELHLVPGRLNLMPHKLADWIADSRLTHWFSVPGVLTLLAQFELVSAERFSELRRVLWCGEVLPTPVLIDWMAALPEVQFTNLYGPTEATIASSYYTVPSVPSDPTEPVPIGRACEGEELLILNDDLRPVPDGDTGDLWIAGVGLSPGYWRDPETTTAAFLPDPREDREGRIYRTGDLASRDSDGLVYFHGREDTQIKSRGYRIELGEIEAAAASLDHLREAAVVATASEGFEGMTICCAYVPDGAPGPSPTDLRESLTERLPSYMMPRKWREMERLPRNANGKVDRPRIREMFREPRNVPAPDAPS